MSQPSLQTERADGVGTQPDGCTPASGRPFNERPFFFIVGAAKAGTTSLFNYLQQHPQVCMSSAKEPNFFSRHDRVNFSKRFLFGQEQSALPRYPDLDAYAGLYPAEDTGQVLGEGSTEYLYFPTTAGQIHEFTPHARVLVVLRNPVGRAFSHYRFNVKTGFEEPSVSFDEALALESERIEAGYSPTYHYVQRGLYHEQVKRYLDLFTPGQVKVVLFEDYKADAAGCLREVCAFLGLDAHGFDTQARHNVTRMPRFPRLHRHVMGDSPLKRLYQAVAPAGARAWVRSRLEAKKPDPMPAATAERLCERFKPDVLKLQDLIGRDLSRWTQA